MISQREIYVSTASLNFDLSKYVRDCGGFPEGHGLEFGAGLTREEALFVLNAAEENACTRFLVHNYFPPPEDPFVLNLASSDPWVRDRSLALCREAMKACVRIGAPFYSIHAGMSIDPAFQDLGRPLIKYDPGNLDIAWELFRENVEELARNAGELGLSLLLENNVFAGFNAPDGVNRLLLFCSLEDFNLFDRAFPQANVGILLDMGHLKVSSRTLGFDPEQAARSVLERTLAIHLHDNDGLTDRHERFNAETWFMNIIPDFPSNVKLIIETLPVSTVVLQDMIDLLRDQGS